MAKKNTQTSEPVANCDQSQNREIENRIYRIRGIEAIVDKYLAELFGVETKRLNEQVRRNIKRFPTTFRFQLTDEETTELIANCDRLSLLKHSSNPPYAFTEQGVR